jgi:hypothetical protein
MTILLAISVTGTLLLALVIDLAALLGWLRHSSSNRGRSRR